MLDRDELIILNWINDHFVESDCFRPQQIYDHNKSNFSNESIVVTTCRKLHARKLIDEMNSSPGDSSKRNSCYRISNAGIDALNPNSTEKKMFKLAKIGATAGIIAAITSIIAVIAVLLG